MTTLEERNGTDVAPTRRGLLGADFWRRMLYAVVSLPVALVGFVLTVVLVGVGAVVSLTVVGAVFLVLAFGVTRGLAAFERARVRWLLRLPAPMPRRRTGRGLLGRLRERRNWREAWFLLLNLPLAVLSFCTVLLLAVLLVRGATYPFLAAGNRSFYEQAWGGPSYLGAVAVHTVPGVLVLLFGPAVLRAVTGLQGRVVQRMICDDPAGR
jgi:hypothetical protein